MCPAKDDVLVTCKGVARRDPRGFRPPFK